jgi:hypothetical protein
MAADPLLFAGSITNALYKFGLVPGSRPADWIRIMLSLGQREAQLQPLLDAGRVAAWRCGMAQYRRQALDLCDGLDDQTVRIALDVPAEVTEPVGGIVTRLRTNPWAGIGAGPGDASLQVMRSVGGFRGFGGPFIRPPYVSSAAGHILAGDGEQWWTVYADCFGTALVRGGSGILPPAERATSPFHLDANGSVQSGSRRARFEQLHDILAVAETDHTLAVSVAYSHRIFLIAGTGSPAC